MSNQKYAKAFACSLLLVTLGVACERNPPESSPEGNSAPPALAPQQVAPPTVAAAPTQAAPPSAQQLPIAEDFEAEAEASIDAKSYKRELSALAQEIEKDSTK